MKPPNQGWPYLLRFRRLRLTGATQRAAHAHHVVVHHNARLVAGGVEFFREEHATAPNTKHVEVSGGGAGDEGAVRLDALPALQLLHRDHVAAASPHVGAVDLEAHCEVAAAVLLEKLLAFVRGRVVACNKMRDAKPN